MAQKHILGIDVSSKDLVIFDTASGSHATIDNTEAAIHKACLQNLWSKDSHLVGLESTGDYGLQTMKTFLVLGFEIKLLNPILTQNAIKRTIRGAKTDATDSELIAELVSKGEGQEISENSLNTEKKTLIRVERKLSAMQSDLKRITKALALKQAAGVDVVIAQGIVSELLEHFNASETQLWQTIADQDTALAKQEQIINSHVGCGMKLSAIISEEAGDIKRFASARQLIAYAGIDPKVSQSGEKDTRGRMTKRGNPNLRHALYLAAASASRFDPQLKDYFERKRTEGKHYTVAVCAVARKMCERIYSTVTHDRMYEKREPAVKEPSLSPENLLTGI